MSDKVILRFINESKAELERIKEALVDTNFENSPNMLGVLQGRARELKNSLVRLNSIVGEELDD